MFCPKCGKDEQMPESYCRQCGEWLPDLTKRGIKSFGGDSPEESLQISLFLSALTAVVALLLAVWLYATYLGRVGTPLIIYVTAAFLLAMAGWQASNFFVSIKLRRSLVRRRKGDVENPVKELKDARRQNAALPEADASQFIHQPTSVTENTTELLQPVGRNRNDS